MFRCGMIVLLGLAFASSFGTPLLAAGSVKNFLLVVWFANHRSVNPISTEANRTVLATGVCPHSNWQQQLQFTEINGVRHLDVGNGSWSPQITKSVSDSDRTASYSPAASD